MGEGGRFNGFELAQARKARAINTRAASLRLLECIVRHHSLFIKPDE
jgi:hypothetical protein